MGKGKVMEILCRNAILESLDSDDNNSLFILPLLERSHVGKITTDLRLGYDFLVSINTRKPVIEINERESDDYRGISSHFQMTRRDLGDNFILYPNQLVITTSLEYISVPDNMFLEIMSRSSYTRLGIHVSTTIQPGYRGCIPIELFNHGNNAIQLVSGSRLFQAKIFKLAESHDYLSPNKFRKYYGHTRPLPSRANTDSDLEILYKYKISK
jgi:dCTP deaminase